MDLDGGLIRTGAPRAGGSTGVWWRTRLREDARGCTGRALERWLLPTAGDNGGAGDGVPAPRLVACPTLAVRRRRSRGRL